MRDSKRVEGDTPVELRTESRKAGTAVGGTCLKLSDSEVITEEPIARTSGKKWQLASRR